MSESVSNLDKLIVNTCVLAGKIMIENGSEMDQVNDSIRRIAVNAHVYDLQAYATLTGIIVSLGRDQGAQVLTINHQIMDLNKVTIVNNYSRWFAEGKLTLKQFNRRLKLLNQESCFFPFWVQLLGAAIVSGAMEVVFRGNLFDFWSTCLIGMLAYAIYYLISKYNSIQFISEFSAAFVIGALAIFATHLHLGTGVDNIVIGGIMPLVPGVQIVNAVRDILTGNVVSGPARAIQAVIIAGALGGGVALALKLF